MSEEKASFWERVMQNVTYCINGVWNDTRALWSVKTLKIINLSVRSFLRHDLQMRAGSLTYNTVLAIVPALAMLFAIGRGHRRAHSSASAWCSCCGHCTR